MRGTACSSISMPSSAERHAPTASSVSSVTSSRPEPARANRHERSAIVPAGRPTTRHSGAARSRHEPPAPLVGALVEPVAHRGALRRVAAELHERDDGDNQPTTVPSANSPRETYVVSLSNECQKT